MTEGQHAAYNLSCLGEKGYYGHVESSDGDVVFSIVETIQLAGFLNNVSPTGDTWSGKSIDWEYPCLSARNASFVVQRESPGSTKVTLVVVEDETPVTLNLLATRMAIYLPVYQLNFTFCGDFFDYAMVTLPNQSWSTPLYRNGSLQWNAYKYDPNISANVPLPDGVLNVSVTVLEKSGRSTEYVLPVVKHSGHDLAVVGSVLFLGVAVSLAIETYRRSYQRRK